MKVHKKDCLFIILMILNESFFYTITDKNFCIWVSIISIILYVIYLANKWNTPNRYKILIYSFVCIQIISVIYSSLVYGQSFAAGLGNMNRFFIYLSFFYFYPYYSNRNNMERLINIIVYLAVIASFILIIQSLLFPKIIFIHNYGVRDGHIRMYNATSLFCSLTCGYLTYQLLSKEFISTFFKLGCILIAIYMGFRSRAELLLIVATIIATLFMYYCFCYKGANRTLIKIIAPFVLLIVLYSVYLLSFSSIDSMKTEIISGVGSGATRINEINYYFSQLKSKWFLGIGTLAGDLAKDVYGTTKYWYYIEDTGILSIVFKNGVIGLLWLIYLIRTLYLSAKNARRSNDSFSFCIIMFTLIHTIVGLTYFNAWSSREKIFLSVFVLIVAASTKQVELEGYDS